jgi:hypothetical protein
MSKEVHSVFGGDTIVSAVATVKNTFGVKVDEEGQIMVCFTTNFGKGSGAQNVPADDFEAVIGVLSEAVERGIKPVEAGVVPPAEIVRRTIRVEDGMVKFRTSEWKGAKPASIPVGEFEAVVKLLQSGAPLAARKAAALRERNRGK